MFGQVLVMLLLVFIKRTGAIFGVPDTMAHCLEMCGVAKALYNFLFMCE